MDDTEMDTGALVDAYMDECEQRLTVLKLAHSAQEMTDEPMTTEAVLERACAYWGFVAGCDVEDEDLFESEDDESCDDGSDKEVKGDE